jgi:5'(3')-deoxyribonucleotidase
MSKKIIGVDIDGVLAEFNSGFAARLRAVTGRDLLPEDITNPPVWNWPTHFGYTEQEVSKAWDDCWQDPEFWLNLDAIGWVDMFFEDLAELDADVYFITDRKGINVKLQTECWLQEYGCEAPTVLIAGDKGPLAKALRLTHFLDDRDKNCQAVAEATDTQVFLLDRNYNRPSQSMLKAAGVTVLTERQQFLEALNGNHN